MKEKVAQSIRDLSIENKRILLAVSGGPDSIALFHSMLAMKDELNLQLLVAHVNHGLRPSAEEEADFVSELAARHGLPFYLLEEDMAALGRREQISEETAGRVARYRFFHRIAEETGSLIATGTTLK
jgi:tRNA(Ile)-lysidine synthase